MKATHRAFFDSPHLALLEIGVATQRVLMASRGACEALGCASKDIEGRPLHELLVALTPQRFENALARLEAGEVLVLETLVRRCDGSEFPVELHADLVLDGNEKHIVAIIFDISERLAQHRQIELLSQAIDSAGDAILVYAVAESGTLEVAYVNETFERQTGYAHDEVIGKDITFFRHGMPDDPGMRAARDAVAQGAPAHVELVSYRKDGTSFWNELTLRPIRNTAGRVTHWVSVERDISNQVARASQLEAEHARLLALTRAIRRLFEHLDRQAVLAAFDQSATELLGARAHLYAIDGDGVARRVDALAPYPTGSGTKDELFERAVSQNTVCIDDAYRRAAAPAGSWADVRYAIELRAAGGVALRETDVFVLDLLARYFSAALHNVALYEELEKRQTSYLELNQTKSDLIAMLAHDVRGPLTSILGYADLTREFGPMTQEQADALDAIKRSAHTLAALATDTLALSQLERNEISLEKQPVDLAVLLHEIVDSGDDEHRTTLSVEGTPLIEGDPQRLRQVFTNLLDNALKYSKEETPISIRVHGEAEWVEVAVTDLGVGIPQEDLGRIFERFTRASNVRTLRIAGTGFGLFLAQQIVKLHGGTITVTSTQGHGSTFTVRLPRRMAVRGSAPTVLIFEQISEEQSFLLQGLRTAGFRANVVSSVQEVLAALEAPGVDALLVDVDEAALDDTPAALIAAAAAARKIPIAAIVGDGPARLGEAVLIRRPALLREVVRSLARLTDGENQN